MENLLFHCENGNDEHRNEHNKIPHEGSVLITPHQATMNIFPSQWNVLARLTRAGPWDFITLSARIIASTKGLVRLHAWQLPSFLKSLSSLLPNVLPIPANGVSDKGCQSSKLNTVRQHVGDWEINWGVILIGLFIKQKIRGQYSAHVVWSPGIVEHSC